MLQEARVSPLANKLLKGGDGWKAETVPGAQAWGGGYRE